MAITTIIPKSITGSEDLVVLSRKEYERMQASMVPTFYLKGRAAKKLDSRVERALREYHSGKTRKIGSLSDLD